MLENRAKISFRQAMFIFIIIVFSPAIRFLPSYAAESAEQSGWLSPIVSVIPLAVFLLVHKIIFTKYKDKSIMDVIYDIFSTWIGKIIVFVYFLWSVWLSAMYMRFTAERLVNSTYPHMDISFFVLAFVILIAYILRKGITIIGRMSEIILPVIILTFFFLIIFLMPNIRPDNVTPVSTKDIVPILKGSMANIAMGIYMFLLFFIGEYINGKEKILKSGGITFAVFVFISVLIVYTTIGTLSSSVVSRLPIPFLIAIKQISILDTIENIEALIVGAWIYSDFILTSLLVFVSINMLKSLFNLKESKYLLNIFLVLIYFLTLGISASQFQLMTFSKTIIIYLNIILALFIPIILLAVGKIRKKL